MAKMFFKKGDKSLTGLYKAGLNDAQIQTDIPSGDYSAYDIITISDDMYNNLYKGKKNWTISGDTVSEVNHTTRADVDQEEFERAVALHLEQLKAFKEQFPSHPKISEINASITFVEAIDTSSLTYPHDDLKSHCVASEKWIELPLI
jgi:hypothetical protein